MPAEDVRTAQSLQVPSRLANADPVFLAEAFEQLNTLLQHAVPAIAFRVMQGLVLVCRPFLEQSRCRIFTPKIGSQGLFEDAPEEHSGPGVFLLPAVEVAMA